MLAVMSGLFLAALDQTIIATALGRIVQDFNAFNELSWVVTAYLLTTTITVPISGKLSDLYGRKTLLLAGVGIFVAASLLSGASQNIEQLIAFRALQGIGAGILTANAFTIIGDLFSPKERPKWQGIIGAVFGLSSVVGPLLGGYLTDAHQVFGATTDWRWTFWINVPIGLAAFYFIARFTPNFKHPRDISIDYKGAALLTVALSSLVLATENVAQIFKSLVDSGVSATAIKAALYGLALVFAYLFVRVEQKAKQPILPPHLFHSSIYRNVMIAVLLMGAAFLGAILYLTQFTQQVFGFNATESGLALMPMIFGLAGCSALAGQVVSRTGKYKIVLLTGLGLATLGIALLSTLDVNSTYTYTAVLMFITGAGLGITMPIFNLVVQNDFPQKELGVVTSSVQLFRGLGSTVGVALLGGILTTGVASSLGNLQDDPYIQTLQQQPQSSQLVAKADADTAIQLNNPATQSQITAGVDASLNSSQLPEPAKKAARDQFTAQQASFSGRVKQAFADSLSHVFIWSASLMAIAFVITLFLKEIPLRHDNETTPVAAGH